MLVIGIIWTLIYSKDGIFQLFITKLHSYMSAPFFSMLFSNPKLAIGGLIIRILFLFSSLYILYLVTKDYAEEYERNENITLGRTVRIVGVVLALFLTFYRGGLNGWIVSILSPAVDSGVLGNAITVMPAVVFALVIKGAGFGMILFLAAIQNISSSVYEAADIDGATTVQKFRYITLPLLKPVILFMVITGTIGALNAFTEIFAMTKGGPIINIGGHPLGVTKLTGYFLFTKWEQSDYGYAAAISYALLVLTLIISVINAKVFKSDEV
jgi:ABC-type sugar transport system permease subunit